MNGIQEVVGSIPIGSTSTTNYLIDIAGVLGSKPTAMFAKLLTCIASSADAVLLPNAGDRLYLLHHNELILVTSCLVV